MAIRRNEGAMPAEQGGRDRGGMMDDRSPEYGHDEDVRGTGESDDDFEDTEDAEEDVEEDMEDEGSF